MMDSKENSKLKKYESIIEEKSKEIRELNDQITTFRLEGKGFSEEERSRYLGEIAKLRVENQNLQDENTKYKKAVEVLNKFKIFNLRTISLSYMNTVL
jgi:hypothetical protein